MCVCVLLLNRHAFPSTQSHQKIQKSWQAAFLCEGITEQLPEVTIVWPLLQRWKAMEKPMEKPWRPMENRQRKSSLMTCLELQLPAVRQVPQKRATAEKDQTCSLAREVTGNCLWIEITSGVIPRELWKGIVPTSCVVAFAELFRILETVSLGQVMEVVVLQSDPSNPTLQASSNTPCPRRSVCDYPHIWIYTI